MERIFTVSVTAQRSPGVELNFFKVSLLAVYINGVLGLWHSDIARAEALPELPEKSHNAFLPIYLGGGVSRVNPTSNSERNFSSGVVGSNVYYRFFMRDTWVVGISGGFKTLIKKSQEEISFFGLAQDSSRLFRIYHPAWLGVGFRTMYLAGAERANLPYERDPRNPPQIGVGLNLSFYYLAARNILIHSEVARWRGTAKNDLHVIEVGLGVSMAVP